MGCLFSNRSRRELIAALTQTDDTEHYQHVTLAYALRSNVLWSVVQSMPRDQHLQVAILALQNQQPVPLWQKGDRDQSGEL